MKKKYHKFIKINEKTLIVGIDIGKSTHYGFLRTMVHEERRSFSFQNSEPGFLKLIEKINCFKDEQETDGVVVAIESTGRYWLPLAYFLESRTDYTLVQVNAKHTKKFKDVTDNTSNKSDHKDPKTIAQIVLIGSGLRVNLPQGQKAALRELTRTRKAIMEDKKRVLNHLHALLAQYNPEILNAFKDLSGKACLFLLGRCPCPEDLAKENEKMLVAELKRISRGRIGTGKVKGLIDGSSNHIGVKEGTNGYRTAMALYIEQVRMYMSQLKKIEREIREQLAFIDEYRILKTINGLGDITIATIVSEVGNFESYESHHELVKYAGINLVEKSSGNHRGAKRISKIGNAHLRTSLYFGALRMVRKGGVFHEQYQRHLSKGMEKNKALIAISRKLLRTIHGMIKNGQGYNSEYEISHIELAA